VEEGHYPVPPPTLPLDLFTAAAENNGAIDYRVDESDRGVS